MDIKSLSSLRYFAYASLFLILIFTFIKPAFVGEIGFLKSIAFWTLQVGLLLPILILVQDGFQSSSLFGHRNSWVITLISGFTSALIFTPCALILDTLFSFNNDLVLTSLHDVVLLSLDEAGALVPPVCISWLAINAPRILQLNFQSTVESSVNKETSSHYSPHVNESSHFLNLLPDITAGDIVYIMSDLHYLRVFTLRGEHLILYSLKNAIEELEEKITGIQTHRSYWVNLSHIEKIVGKSPDRKLLTHQGHLIPVSRRKYKTIKEVVLPPHCAVDSQK